MRILIIIFCLSFLLLSGCVSQAKYDGIEAERDTLLEENQALTQDKLELQQELDALQGEHATLQEKYGKVSNLREFKDASELRLWLSLDDTDKMEFIENTQDCDDSSRILMLNAFQDGYILAILVDGEHIKNVTFIGDEVYLIEPQTDGVEFGGFIWE